MSLTREQIAAREQVAGLVPGDVVELRENHYPDVVVRGALHLEGAALCLGRYLIRDGNGAPGGAWTLTVQSRAPYANHTRNEVRPGDVIRDEDGTVWLRDSFGNWQSADEEKDDERLLLWSTGPRPTLLIDGETGQVVP